MAGKQLKSLVTVHDEQGVAHLFGPHDVLPDWARAKITNPNVWDGDDAAETLVPTPPATPTPPGDEPGSEDDEETDTDGEPGDEPGSEDDEETDTDGEPGDDDSSDDTDGVITDGAPPRAGRGSGIANWKTWADEQGVQYPADITRDDLVALIDAAASSQE